MYSARQSPRRLRPQPTNRPRATARRPPSALRLPLVSLAVLALSCSLAVPATAQTQPVIPPGVTVGGVAVGGLTREQARATITEAIARPLGRRLVVAVGARRFSVLPRQAGVSVRVDLLVARALRSAPGRNVQVRPTLLAKAPR